MPNINKPFYALAYSALGVTLPPMTFKAAEIVSGFTFSPTIWKLVWLASIISLIILVGSLLYIIIYVVPIEKLVYKVIHPIVSLFIRKDETDSTADIIATEELETDGRPESQVNKTTQEAKEEPLDERHTMFQPYVNDDCNDLPTMPVLDILDEVFKNNNQKKEVGMALYSVKSLKWITKFPPYKEMAAIFGEGIVGSPSNYATYMPPIREVDKDYGMADDDFLVDLREMKARIRKAAGI